MTDAELCSAMRGIEAAHARVTGDDEPGRAKRAMDDIRRRLVEARSRENDVECSYAIPDPREMDLFIALCVRYGLDPFRRPRQRGTSVLVLAPASFMKTTFWPEFVALADQLKRHLSDVTGRVLCGAFPETVVNMPDGFDAKLLGAGT